MLNVSVQDALVYFRHFSSYDSSNRIKQCAVSTRGSKSVENNNPTGVKMPQRCTKKKIKLGFWVFRVVTFGHCVGYFPTALFMPSF